MRRRAAWIAVTLVSVAAVLADVPELVRGPAPYPPEWQWLRRDVVSGGPFGPVLLVGALLAGVLLASGSEAARRQPRAAARLVLAAATVLGVALSFSLLALEPGGAVDALYGRVVYRTATSYYTVAIAPEAADPVELVARHHELLPGWRTAAKHAATHPPGPILYYRAVLAACESSPALTRAVLAATGVPEANPRRPRPQHAAPARAAALLGGALTIVLCALVAWPLAVLARALGASPLAAARVGALWVIVPGPAVMAPMLDQLVALPVAIAASAMAVLAVARAEAVPRRVWRPAVVAGLAGGGAVLLSYGAAAFLAIAGLAAIGLGRARGASWLSLAAPLGTAGVLALLVFVTPARGPRHPSRVLHRATAVRRVAGLQPRGRRALPRASGRARLCGTPPHAAEPCARLRARRGGRSRCPPALRRHAG
jgi:hypothetical protein